MWWTIDIARTEIFQGEDVAFDIYAFNASGSPLNIMPYSVVADFSIDGVFVERASDKSNMPGTLKINRSTEKNRFYVNIPGSHTKSYKQGRMSMEINLYAPDYDVASYTYNKDTVKVKDSKIKDIL